jgi:hypothetical protein
LFFLSIKPEAKFQDVAQIIFWAFAGFSALVAAVKIPIELSEGLKWRKTDTAKKIHDDMMLHEGAKNARNMLDYHHGRLYDLSDYINDIDKKGLKTTDREKSSKKEINIDNVAESLGKDDRNLKPEDMFIRD